VIVSGSADLARKVAKRQRYGLVTADGGPDEITTALRLTPRPTPD
jgi:hypothetical protein